MQTKNTIILAIVTLLIIGAAVAAGVISQLPAAQPPVAEAPKQEAKKPPTDKELAALLAKEQAAIDQALAAAYPQIAMLYTVGLGKLYDDGNWYGTTLIYKGADEKNRDTLRLIMHKKDSTWTVRTSPPAAILFTGDYPDVPASIIKDLNRPAPLPGTSDSPAIN